MANDLHYSKNMQVQMNEMLLPLLSPIMGHDISINEKSIIVSYLFKTAGNISFMSPLLSVLLIVLLLYLIIALISTSAYVITSS